MLPSQAEHEDRTVSGQHVVERKCSFIFLPGPPHFSVAPETGVPDLLAHFVSNHGFTLDPSGRFVLVANQDTYRSVIFSIDLETGWFVETG